nr:ethylene-responsive transcription factor ERF105-like [Aegilops tauschii subsp. strangulata]
MPPRHRGGSGYCGVRVRPSGTYSASIRLGGGVRLGLGTFDTAQDGARAYDAAAWRLRRSRWDMNFTDVATPERAQELAPFPRLITDEDRRKNQRRERRLSLAEMDEEAMALWRQRFPQDIINEEQRRLELCTKYCWSDSGALYFAAAAGASAPPSTKPGSSDAVS